MKTLHWRELVIGLLGGVCLMLIAGAGGSGGSGYSGGSGGYGGGNKGGYGMRSGYGGYGGGGYGMPGRYQVVFGQYDVKTERGLSPRHLLVKIDTLTGQTWKYMKRTHRKKGFHLEGFVELNESPLSIAPESKKDEQREPCNEAREGDTSETPKAERKTQDF